MKLAIAIAAKNAAPSAFVVWRGFEEAVEKSSGLDIGLFTSSLEVKEDVFDMPA